MPPPNVAPLRFWPRLRAWFSMLFLDHSIFRFVYNTRARVGGSGGEVLYRSGHPMPYQLRAAKRAGVKAVLSLRGAEPHVGSNRLEWDTVRREGLELVHFPIGSRNEPSREEALMLIELLARLPKPLLVHCKSGADRAGLASTIWQIEHGLPLAEAMRQLEFWRHGHVRQAKTGILDAFFAEYGRYAAAHPGTTFRDWVANHYDAAALKASFRSSFWANQLVDRILRRE